MFKPAYRLSVRKLSLAVKVRSHTQSCPPIFKSSAKTFSSSSDSQLSFLFTLFLPFYSEFLFLPSSPDTFHLSLNSLVYFRLFIFLHLSLPDARLLLAACCTCTAHPCPHKSSRTPGFFYLEEWRIKLKTEE